MRPVRQIRDLRSIGVQGRHGRAQRRQYRTPVDGADCGLEGRRGHRLLHEDRAHVAGVHGMTVLVDGARRYHDVVRCLVTLKDGRNARSVHIPDTHIKKGDVRCVLFAERDRPNPVVSDRDYRVAKPNENLAHIRETGSNGISDDDPQASLTLRC